jgi:hypothetical protein
VLGVAGVAKLRSPAPVRGALVVLGLPASRSAAYGLAGLELGLCGWCLIAPSPIGAVALAGVYAGLATAAGLLARRGASCGCFGEGAQPASPGQAAVSAALAAIALSAAVGDAHGVGWVGDRPAGQAAVLIIATAAAVWATVLAYTELPRAWGAWSPR